MNETTIKIKMSPDGKNCVLEIVEEDAKTGTRIDQRVARAILELDKAMQDPQFMQAMQSMQAQQSQARWMSPNQRPMTPFGGVPSPNPNPGFFGGGPGMNFGSNTGYNNQ
jgi:flagellar biosynthesis chaperone FliJ